MLQSHDFKNLLNQTISQGDKLLLALAFAGKPSQIKELNKICANAGFRWRSGFNASAILSRSKGRAIRTGQGWELSNKGIRRLESLGVDLTNKKKQSLSLSLRDHAEDIASPQIKKFVEEAIACYENDLLRSAVVMSWLCAVAVLQNHVVNSNLPAFNARAKQINGKWKKAVTADDIGLMKERDFLDALQFLSIIGKNVKGDLIECLNRRNGCGHPNSYKLGENVVAAHIETLILNVFSKF